MTEFTKTKENARPEATPAAAETKPRFNPKEGLSDAPTKQREQLAIGNTEAKADRSAWENPGTFAVCHDDKNNRRIEGWLSLDHQDRSSADKKLQSEIGRSGSESKREDGSHLIAVSLGGPLVAGHGEGIARANLVPGDARMNRSYMAGVEEHLRAFMRASPETRLYMQVDTRQRGRNDFEVTHRVFEKDENGTVAKHGEFVSNVNLHSAETQSNAVKQSTGESGQAFYGPDQKGTVPLSQ